MPESLAGTADLVVVAVYLVVSLVLGLGASGWLRGGGATGGDGARSADREEDYFLAGRRVPGWVNGISSAATALNADVGSAYCGVAVVVGLPVAFFYLPRFALAWMLAATLFAVRWRQLNVRTGPEFYSLRFGGDRTRFVRIYSSLFAVMVNMVPWIGAGMLGLHNILGPAFDIKDKAITLSIVLPILLVYVWSSGFAGVVVTDVMQSCVIVAASVVLLVAVLWEHGGPAGLAAGLAQSLPPADAAEALSTWPVWDHRVLGPLVVLAWLIPSTIGRGGSVDLDGQRLFSCRSDRDAANMNVWALAGLCLMLLLLTLPTLGLLVKHPELYHADTAQRELAYSMLLAEYLPRGLYGVAIAGLLAAVMSTISSYLSYGSQTLVNDVLRQLSSRSDWLAPGSPAAVNVGRVCMLVILGLGVGVTYVADSLFGIALVLLGMYGATATVYWGQWWWWRVNFWSWLTAMVGGPLVYVALGGLKLGESIDVPGVLSYFAWWQEQVALGGATADSMSALQAVLAMALTLVLWVVVTLVTQPEPMDRLCEFYRRARPMGLWGPVRDACAANDPSFVRPPTGLLAGGVLIATLGAAAVVLAVVALSVACVGRWGECLLLAGAAAVCGFAFLKTYNWHLHRLGADVEVGGDDAAG
ncbi:MAG: sodium:solute symporter family transporter [Lacipirellulaceae bacterium]